MTEFRFSLPRKFTGRIVSDENIAFDQKAQLLLEAYVPGIEFTPQAQSCDFTLYHKESDARQMIVEKDKITIHDAWNGELSSDAYHLLAGVARQHYIKNHLFPVHAACVGLDNLILIAGHSGSGKTTVSLELVRNGMKLYSGNKTVVSLEQGLEAVAGTRTMTARKEDLRQSVRGIHYGDRTAFSLNKRQYAKQGNIAAIVLVRLNEGRQEWRKLRPASALHELYPYFLDTVNADVIVGQDVFDGSVPQQTKEYLARRLGRAVESVPAYAATGSLAFITDKIMKVRTAK